MRRTNEAHGMATATVFLIDPPVFPLSPKREIVAWIATLDAWATEPDADLAAIDDARREATTWLATEYPPNATPRSDAPDDQRPDDAPDPGTYVGRALLNTKQLSAWWDSVRKDGEPDLDENPHLTVVYSRASFATDLDPSHVVIHPPQMRFGVLGKDNAVVVHLDSPILQSRYETMQSAGATSDFPGYKPHMTLFYLGSGYDATDWRDGPDKQPAVPPFSLVFGPEVSGPLSSDVFDQATGTPTTHGATHGLFTPERLRAWRAEYLASRFARVARVTRFNPNHSPHTGQFASASGAGDSAGSTPGSKAAAITHDVGHETSGEALAKLTQPAASAAAAAPAVSANPNKFPGPNAVGKTAAEVGYPSTVNGVDISGEKILTPYDTAAVLAARATVRGQPQTVTMPDRDAIRANALDKAIAGTAASNQDRVAHIIIGGPGAGKSSALADHLVGQDGARLIDADVVKQHLPEYDNGKGAGVVHAESAMLAEGPLLDHAVSNGDNIVMPKVGKSPAGISEIAQRLKDEGYSVSLHYVDVEPGAQAERIIARFEHTGRFVDTHYVVNDVDHKPKATFEQLKDSPLFEHVTHVNNNVPFGHRPIVTPHRSDDGGEGTAAPLPGLVAVRELWTRLLPFAATDRGHAPEPIPEPDIDQMALETLRARAEARQRDARRLALRDRILAHISAVTGVRFNQNHAPAGESDGGQFTSDAGGAGESTSKTPSAKHATSSKAPAKATDSTPGASAAAENYVPAKGPAMSAPDAVAAYVGGQGRGYVQMNGYLRTGVLPAPHPLGRAMTEAQVATATRGIDHAIAAEPPLAKSTVLFRAIDPTQMPGYAAGSGKRWRATINDQGFTSTTSSLSWATQFAGHLGKKAAIVEIRVPAGTHALDVDAHGWGGIFREQEFILPRGGTYRITGTAKDAHGWHYVASYAPPGKRADVVGRAGADAADADHSPTPSERPDASISDPAPFCDWTAATVTVTPLDTDTDTDTDADTDEARATRFNQNHAPSGSSDGGQFTSGDGGGGGASASSKDGEKGGGKSGEKSATAKADTKSDAKDANASPAANSEPASPESHVGEPATKASWLAANPKGNGDVFDAAQQYTASADRPPLEVLSQQNVNADEGRSIADAYDAAKDDPSNADTQAAYAQFNKELAAQRAVAESAGYKFEAWDKAGQPYQNSAEMMKDVRDNQHLYYFKSIEGTTPNQLMSLEQNDTFRSVHDLFGHAMGGNQFGPKGETNAFLDHAQMFSPLARRALATETLGQNCVYNWAKDNVGKPINERHFADQKAFLLDGSLYSGLLHRAGVRVRQWLAALLSFGK